MIFKQIDEILSGIKTQTRRVVVYGEYSIAVDDDGTKALYKRGKGGKFRLTYMVGKTYPIIPKRGHKAIEGKRIKVTALRVERLQAITEADAFVEGCRPFVRVGDSGYNSVVATAKEMYKRLWESINNTKGVRWDDNPLVAVITFEVM